MILFLVALVLYCAVAPVGLVVGGLVAALLAAASFAVALLAAGPGALLAARLTASPRGLARAVGWLGLSGSVVVAIAAVAGAVLFGLLAAAAAGLLPGWGC